MSVAIYRYKKHQLHLVTPNAADDHSSIQSHPLKVPEKKYNVAESLSELFRVLMTSVTGFLEQVGSLNVVYQEFVYVDCLLLLKAAKTEQKRIIG